MMLDLQADFYKPLSFSGKHSLDTLDRYRSWECLLKPSRYWMTHDLLNSTFHRFDSETSIVGKLLERDLASASLVGRSLATTSLEKAFAGYDKKYRGMTGEALRRLEEQEDRMRRIGGLDDRLAPKMPTLPDVPLMSDRLAEQNEAYREQAERHQAERRKFERRLLEAQKPRPPEWHETWWFKIALGSSLVLLGFFLNVAFGANPLPQ